MKRSGKFVAVLEQTHCGSGITTMRVPLGYKVLEDVGESFLVATSPSQGWTAMTASAVAAEAAA